jgi:hypothetical protein
MVRKSGRTSGVTTAAIWINDSNQLVGLNFAGSSGRAVENRIQSVLQALNINFDSGITMHAFVAATNAVLN